MKQSPSQSILFFIAAVVIAAAGIATGVWLSQDRDSTVSGYSAVYLTTGDIYFGKLSWFPRPHMTNVWFLQKGADQATSGILPFAGAVWKPVDEIYLNSNAIVLWSAIRSDSDLVKFFNNPTSIPQRSAPPPATP